MTTDTSIRQYRLLGRTGLRVSPIALDALTFGAGGWHAGEDTARSVFLRYLDSGGNLVDTAINYAAGRSEQLLGAFIKETGTRDQVADRMSDFAGSLAAVPPRCRLAP
jgi:aryl-alcohol dehydrogenase-like predicted oxidoreductase